MPLLSSPIFRLRNLFLFSLVLHVAIVFALANYRHPILWENGAIAAHLYQGDGFVIGFSLPDEPTALQAPGYPYLLVGLWSFFGFNDPTGYLFLSLVQALAVSLAIFPIVWLARRWFDENVAIIAGVLVILMPLLAWYATRIHHTALVMAIHPWLVWGWVTASDGRSWKAAIVAGFFTGLAGLFQPVLLPAYAAISAFLLLRAGMGRNWNAAGRIFAAGCLTLLVQTPWAIRNYQVFHQLVVVKDNFGKEFWEGNNPQATGTGYTVEGYDMFAAHPPQAGALRGKEPEIVVMKAVKDETLRVMMNNPVVSLERIGQKFFWYWTLTPTKFERSSGGGEAIKFRGLQATYWFSYVLLMIIGKFRRSWPWEYVVMMIIFAVVYSLVYSLSFVGQARFRGEIEFIFLPAVACGIAVLLPESWKLSPRKE